MRGATYRALASLLLLTAAAICCPSCASLVRPGRIFTQTVQPLTINFDRTPVVNERPADGDVKEFRYYVQIDWDKNGIGSIAKASGFEEVYYADEEVLSVLGIWTQVTVRVYGREKKVAEK